MGLTVFTIKEKQEDAYEKTRAVLRDRQVQEKRAVSVAANRIFMPKKEHRLEKHGMAGEMRNETGG